MQEFTYWPCYASKVILSRTEMTDNLAYSAFLTIVLIFSGSLAHIFGGGGFAHSLSLILLAITAFFLSLVFIKLRVQKLFELEFLSFLIIFQLLLHLMLPNANSTSDLRMMASHGLAVSISFIFGERIDRVLNVAIQIIRVVFLKVEFPLFTPQRAAASIFIYDFPAKLSFNYFSNLFSGLAPPAMVDSK